MSTDKLNLPLSGVRILDLSRILAGPMAAMALGDLGAEVIKVELPGRGDDTRDWGLRVGKTETAYFNSANRNKSSITLDLKSEQGVQIAKDLAAKCDVVIHNFKVGTVERMGLDYETLKEINPQIIYCSISGYNSDGPEAKRPGYDLVIQGEAGLMALNGEENQPPLKFGVAVVDMFTGMYSAQAIIAALYQRNTTKTGRNIQMALFDCGLMINSYYGLESLLQKKDPPKYGNNHPSIMPYGVFNASDGPLVITVGNNNQFDKFCRAVIERNDLADDERFKTNISRAANRVELNAELVSEIAKRPRALLLSRLREAGIPCGEVFGLYEALTSQRAIDGELVQSVAHPDVGSTNVLAPPYRFDGVRPPVRKGPPQLGSDTTTVLKDILNFNDAQLADLKDNKVI